VALSFHRESPLNHGPFVALDCRSEESRLRSALQALLAKTAPDPGPDPIRAAWGGTLFLDEVEALSADTQRLLLCFAKQSLGGSVAAEAGCPVRLTAGASESPDAATSWSLLPELHDEIDKIRVDLDEVHAGAA
jgi:DNA-binding NtrC family response regulator